MRQTYLHKKNERLELYIKQAISFLIHLISDIFFHDLKSKEYSQRLLQYFSNKDKNNFSGFFIFGKNRGLDFSQKDFEHCGFYGYSLSECDFEKAYFKYTTIEAKGESIPSTISEDTFDCTCETGSFGRSLKESFAPKETAFRRFFDQFYINGKFVAIDERKLRFPDGHGAQSAFFRTALGLNIIFKDDFGKIGVAKSEQHSVHGYLTNNTVTRKLNKVLALIGVSNLVT